MKDKILFARTEESILQLVKKICRARGETLSDFVRRAVRRELARMSYLSDEEKKALGIPNDSIGGVKDESRKTE